MAIAQTNERAPQRPLRLWPGVVAVLLQWLLRFGLKMVVPGHSCLPRPHSWGRSWFDTVSPPQPVSRRVSTRQARVSAPHRLMGCEKCGLGLGFNTVHFGACQGTWWDRPSGFVACHAPGLPPSPEDDRPRSDG